MRYKPSALIFFCLISAAFAFNSCKKTGTDSIRSLLTSGAWEVSSIMVFNYVGDTQLPNDTLNTECDVKQIFKFNLDESCTYSNYYCIEQTTNGRWSLSNDKLFLISDIVCRDTTDTGEPGTSKPFENTRIVNLGQYSMVLQTGDLQSNYFPTQRRRIVQYGFVRQKTPVSSN
ncbi:MAG: hypothetical protein EOP47_29670 [Sphingobacteriaceae bacterium]|nr:MAG: hypothetical protein EOP47_29670 [Sphingobacteriaceae bacterium]